MRLGDVVARGHRRFDPTHQAFEASRHWVGPAFEPERFDVRLVNQQLERS